MNRAFTLEYWQEDLCQLIRKQLGAEGFENFLDTSSRPTSTPQSDG